MIQKTLMQKSGIVVQQLAQDLINMEVGDRIPTVDELSTKYTSARGTVQQAILRLKDYGAISSESKGHLGTFLKEINYVKLMEICSTNGLAGVMPLPYSKRYEGLASAIYATLNENTGISVNLAFMGGSLRRIEDMLSGRYDFAVISLYTAKHYIKEGKDIVITNHLGVHSYVNAHTLIMRSDFDKTPKYIGVDSTSFDQLSMTTNYFKNKQIQLVPLKYGHILENIKNRTIDAAIWSLEEKIIGDAELRYEYLQDEIYHKDHTIAAVVAKKDDFKIINFMKRFFNGEKVEQIQQGVLNDKIVPTY